MKTEQNVIGVVGGIIRRGDKYLLGRRPVVKSLGGHWEFIGFLWMNISAQVGLSRYRDLRESNAHPLIRNHIIKPYGASA